MDEKNEYSKRQLLQRKQMELELERQKATNKQLLPHLFGTKLYRWQREFLDSHANVKLLCAANQIGKSSIGIRRHVANATDPARWKQFFRRTPKQFWYLYPDSETLKREWETKWVPEWMPRGKMQHDPQYGWTVTKEKGIPLQINWRSGVITYFLFYSKKAANMQAATVDDVTCDEELPVEIYDEIMFRMTSTGGAFNMVFTPTLNQPYWKSALEKATVLPEALKLTVSMYDCLVYEDGSPSTAFTLDKIKAAESKCSSNTEVLRRIHGKFVTEEGRMYHAFDPEKNTCAPRPYKHLPVYATVDGGSGGEGRSAHPAAIAFIAVEPNYQHAYVIASWRGDGIKTTAGDVFDKYREMRSELGLHGKITQAWYDPAYVDFGTLAQRQSEPFNMADKSRDKGQEILNTLFKYEMLYLFDDDTGNGKLSNELSGLMKTGGSGKNKRGDDLSDALRYGVIGIPWDFEPVEKAYLARQALGKEAKQEKQLTEKELLAIQVRLRRGEDVYGDQKENGWAELDAEIDEWNDLSGN